MARLISDYATSRFMKKEDVNAPKTLTISEIKDENVAHEGQKPEVKPVAYWKEDEKPLILNITNLRRIAGINGSADLDQWGGTVVECFNDVGVVYQGHQGAVRVQDSRGNMANPGVAPQSVEQAVSAQCDDLPSSWGQSS